MICSKCTLEKLAGKVVRGAFVCKQCLEAERTEKKKLHVDAKDFYSVRVRTQVPADKMFILTKATYKRNERFWSKITADPDWWGEDRMDTKWSPDKLPGSSTPEEAMKACLANELHAVKRAQDALDRATAHLNAFYGFAGVHGFDMKPGEDA